jgi:hypothetical protein
MSQHIGESFLEGTKEGQLGFAREGWEGGRDREPGPNSAPLAEVGHQRAQGRLIVD